MVGMDLYIVTVPDRRDAAHGVGRQSGERRRSGEKLNDIGGEFPAWTRRRQEGHWSLGNALVDVRSRPREGC